MSQSVATPPVGHRPFGPLDPIVGEEHLISPLAQQRWLLALMVLGLVLRLTRYMLRFPLWEDEAMLSANLIDRGYRELLQPLHYCQVAPPLFLWGQLTLVKLFGFNEYVLRLIPFLCGLGSLALFRHVAGRLLRGISLLFAVGLFAVAYPMTRYAAEAKPYGCDLFIALAMLALVVEWLRQPDRTGWLWCLAAMVGPAIGYSFPTIFVAGGISLTVFGALRAPTSSSLSFAGEGPGVRAAAFSRWLPWLVFNVILIAGFAALLIVSKTSVGATNQQTMEDTHWADTFPPIAQPLKLPLWLLKTHAGAMLGYPIGGPNFGSTASLLCLIAGLVVLVRRRAWLLMFLLLTPLGLNFIAAALHKFPYGGHARMTLFLAPAFCILIALGLTAFATWIAAQRSKRRSPALGKEASHLPSRGSGRGAGGEGILIVLSLLVLLGLTSWIRDITHPYKSGTTLRAREFAQWFWFELAHDGELVSCETDMKTDMSPDKLNCGWSSLYFCNQRIYSPRHARGERPQWSNISSTRPLRCVLYRSPIEERESPAPDPQARQRWLDAMQTERNLELVAYDTYPFAAYDKSEGQKKADDYIEVFKFLPKGANIAAGRGKTER